MKKLLIISILGAIVAGPTSMALGQGYMSFGAAARTVTDVQGMYDIPPSNSGFVATFVWSATSTTAPIQGNPFFIFAWNDLENLPAGWQFGIDAGTGTNVYGLPANNLGSFSYEGTAAFPLSGSTGPGEVINIQAIAWDTDGGLYTSLAAAEAGGAIVGWSSEFQYTLGYGPPTPPPAETVIPHFAIGPEPTTLPLIGLGGISLLFVRRIRGCRALTKLDSQQMVEYRR